MAFKVLCVDHVGVAVNDLALIKKQMKDLLNLEPSLPDETVEEWMKDVVDFDILPMLSEYWFDESSKLQRWENILHGVFQ